MIETEGQTFDPNVHQAVVHSDYKVDIEGKSYTSRNFSYFTKLKNTAESYLGEKLIKQ